MEGLRQGDAPSVERREWHVVVVALPGCLVSAIHGSLEALAISDALRPAGAPSLLVEVASEGSGPVVGFGGQEVRASRRLDALSDADALILPPVVADPSGLVAEQGNVVASLQGAVANGVIAAAACTGTFLVAETGVLDGRRATTTPQFRDTFARRYPKVRLRTALRVVDEGTVITAGATTSYLDLALALVGRMLGPGTALETARILSTDPNPRSQQPFLLPRPPRLHTDEEIRKAEQWMASHLDEDSDTASLARVAGLGDRTFLRRFRAATGESPREYLQRTRIEAAMKDLEATNLSIEEVTAQCGYGDARSFRRLFRRLTGVSPGEYRRRFGFGG